MRATNRFIDQKTAVNPRSKSAIGARNVVANGKAQQPFPLRSTGPITRSMTRGGPNDSQLTKNGVTKESTNVSARALLNGRQANSVADTTKPPVAPASRKSAFSTASRQISPLISKIATRLIPSRGKLKEKDVTASKDSVISDEMEDVQWVAGTEYEFGRDRTSIFPDVGRDVKRDASCSYLRVSQVLNGYGSPVRRSKTPDADELSRVRKTIFDNSVGQSPTAVGSPIAAVKTTLAGSEVSDKGFCEGRAEMDECFTYSFAVPPFAQMIADGAAYRRLMDEILATFNAHVAKCNVLLDNQSNLPDEVAEIVRVACGRTQLLMRKRLTQFNQQLERHLNPVPGENETTLNDLHGLWSLVDIQIDDIRSAFDDVESCRKSEWQAPASSKPTLTAATSMPSLRVIQPTTEKGKANGAAKTATHKTSADESGAAAKENLAHEKSLAAAKKRQEDIRKRQEFLRSKRQQMAAETAICTADAN